MAYKCSYCGIESEVEQAFSKVRIGTKNEYCCPTCQEKRSTKNFKDSLIWYFLAGLVGFGLWLVSPYHLGGEILLGVFSLIFFLFPLIIFHELAHASAAHILGLRVFAIHIGYGKVLYSTYLGKIAVLFRRLPIGGLTFVSAPRLPFYHLRFGLTYLAGPFIHLTILLGMGPFWLQMRGAIGSDRIARWLICYLPIG